MSYGWWLRSAPIRASAWPKSHNVISISSPPVKHVACFKVQAMSGKWKEFNEELAAFNFTGGHERVYLIASVVDLRERVTELSKELAFEKAVNQRVGEVVVDMFKKLT